MSRPGQSWTTKNIGERIIFSSGDVFIAPLLFQIPDNTACLNSAGGSQTPYAKGAFQYWDSVPSTGTFSQFNGCDIVDYALLSGGLGAETNGWGYQSSYATLGSVCSSTFDAAINLETGIPSKDLGSRGYNDMPLNNCWVGVNQLAVTAGLKEFKNEASFIAVLPAGDLRSFNYINLGSLYTPAYLGTGLHQIPLALGVYINNIFYTMPTGLTGGGGIQASSGFKAVIAAARPSASKVLTAVAADNNQYGDLGNYPLSVNGYVRAIVGLSDKVAPTVTETITLASGMTSGPQALNGTLSVTSATVVDCLHSLSGRGVIQWLEFSPDGYFLYMGMYWTPNSTSQTTGDEYAVYFMIRRWHIFDGFSVVTGEPVTIYTSPNPIIQPTGSPTVYPVGGFRCQMNGTNKHTIGFVQYEAASGGSGTSTVSVTVDANLSAPSVPNTVANASIQILPPYAGAGSTYFAQTANTGITFVDYVNNIFIVEVTNSTWHWTNTGESNYCVPAVFAGGTLSLLPLNAFNFQGVEIFAWYTNGNLGMPPPLVAGMFGNRCALSRDGKYVYTVGFVGSEGIQGGNNYSPPGGVVNQKASYIKLNLNSLAYTLKPLPNNFMPRYIVTSTT